MQVAEAKETAIKLASIMKESKGSLSKAMNTSPGSAAMYGGLGGAALGGLGGGLSAWLQNRNIGREALMGALLGGGVGAATGYGGKKLLNFTEKSLDAPPGYVEPETPERVKNIKALSEAGMELAGDAAGVGLKVGVPIARIGVDAADRVSKSPLATGLGLGGITLGAAKLRGRSAMPENIDKALTSVSRDRSRLKGMGDSVHGYGKELARLGDEYATLLNLKNKPSSSVRGAAKGIVKGRTPKLQQAPKPYIPGVSSRLPAVIPSPPSRGARIVKSIKDILSKRRAVSALSGRVKRRLPGSMPMGGKSKAALALSAMLTLLSSYKGAKDLIRGK